MSGLLEYILSNSNFSYISDLSRRINDQTIKEVLHKACVQDYSLKEWTEAINYLAGSSISFETLDDIKNYISKL